MSDRISLKDFAKIDLRVGHVVEAEKIPGSRKLIKLIVDLGSEKRQVIAGLAEWYSPEDLKDKYVVLVANLEPKVMMGYESNGMILAAGCSKGDTPVILTVEKPVKAGTKIC